MNTYPSKTYIAVTALISPDGTMMPLSLTWEDGRTFDVDRVVEVKRRPSKAGGGRLRYTCVISGREKHLFLEDDGRWFVEVDPPLG